MSKKKDHLGPIHPPRMDSRSEMELRGIRPLASRGKQSRRMARWILAAMVLLVLVAGVTMFNGVRINAKTAEQNVVTSEQNWNPAFKVRYGDLGKDVIAQWYSLGKQPIPTGKGVNWPGVKPDDPQGSNSSQDNSAPANTEKKGVNISSISLLEGKRYDAQFTRTGISEGHVESLSYLITVNGKQYVSAITLNITDDDPKNPDKGKPVLTSTPTLLPYNIFLAQNNDVTSEPLDLPKPQESPNDSTKTALNSFLTAWTKNDPVALKQIAQDNDPTHAYYGLGNGWKLSTTTPTINWTRVGKVGVKDYTIMNVTFTIQSLGPLPQAKGDQQPTEADRPVYTMEQTLEITIDKYNEGLPTIVAWGASGTWPTLEPYSNAVVLKKGEVPTTATDEATDEATDQPSDAPSGKPSTTPTPSDSGKGK